MGAGISPTGANIPQQATGLGKGGGAMPTNGPTQQMGATMAGSPLQAALGNAPAPMPAPGLAQQMNTMTPGQAPMSIDEFARSGMMGPTTQEFRAPVAYNGGMHDPALVSAYQSYIGGDQQRMAQNPMGMQGDAFRAQQMSMDALNQARQAGLQVGPTPGQPPNPYARMSVPQLQQMNEQIRMQQMQMQANALQGRRLAPQVNDQMQQPMQQALQQQMQAQRQMQNMDPRQLQQINEQIRMQQMDPRQLQQINEQMQMQMQNMDPRQMQQPMQQALQAPRQMQNMQPMPRDPRFGGLGALMQARRGPRQSIFQARNGMGKGGGGFFR